MSPAGPGELRHGALAPCWATMGESRLPHGPLFHTKPTADFRATGGSGPQLVFTHQPRQGGLCRVLGAPCLKALIPSRALTCLFVALKCRRGGSGFGGQ